MIRDEVMQLLKNMNELFRAGWSVSYIQHEMGKESKWFKDYMKKEEHALYEEMKKFYAFWRKRTSLAERLPNFWDHRRSGMH